MFSSLWGRAVRQPLNESWWTPSLSGNSSGQPSPVAVRASQNLHPDRFCVQAPRAHRQPHGRCGDAGRARHRRSGCGIGRLEQATFDALELDADGVIVAFVATAPVRAAGMPGALVAVDELPSSPWRRMRGAQNLQPRICARVGWASQSSRLLDRRITSSPPYTPGGKLIECTTIRSSRHRPAAGRSWARVGAAQTVPAALPQARSWSAQWSSSALSCGVAM